MRLAWIFRVFFVLSTRNCSKRPTCNFRLFFHSFQRILSSRSFAPKRSAPSPQRLLLSAARRGPALLIEDDRFRHAKRRSATMWAVWGRWEWDGWGQGGGSDRAFERLCISFFVGLASLVLLVIHDITWGSYLFQSLVLIIWFCMRSHLGYQWENKVGSSSLWTACRFPRHWLCLRRRSRHCCSL